MMNKKLIFFSLMLITSSVQVTAQRKIETIIYKAIDTVSLAMKVYYPDDFKPGDRRSAIVLFFGGGWNNGNADQFKNQAIYFSGLGMIAITPDYRVKARQNTTPFESVKDARSAIRYIRSNADKLGIIPDKIAAGGGSAGGHIAAAADLCTIDETTDDLNVDARPNALVLFNPVFNNGPGNYGYDRFRDKYTQISPYHNIKKGAAPAIVFLGTNDKLVPVKTAEMYKQKMEEAGSRCDLVLYEGQGHGFFNYKANKENTYYDKTLKEATTFLKSLDYIQWAKNRGMLLFEMNTAGTQPRPNILWVTIEDTSPNFIGCYGNADARTPNIDRLAAEGVRFTNAFSTNTVCSPSRTTIITGVRTYETGTGHHRSKYRVPDFMNGFPHYMQQAGYYTINNAKTDYNIANEKKYIQQAWNESSNTAGWWNRKPGQPFFAVFNFNDSHQSRTMTYPYGQYVKEVLDELPSEDRISDTAFQMPPFFRDCPEMRKQFARVYNSIRLTDNKIGALLKRLDQDHLTDSTIIFFYGDHGEGIPKGKTNGINLGYRVPFAIWFPPMYKHLSPWGTGVISDELIDFEDLAPTLINIAEGKVPDYMKGRTLIGNKRSQPVPFLELSSDRSDNGIDMVRSITDGKYMYCRNYMPFMPQARYINYMEIGEIKQLMRKDLAAGKLNANQKQLFEPRPAEFLFDIENDPWELNNLAGDPKYKAQLLKMQSQLDQSILKSRDVMFLPEYELAAISKRNETAYEFRMNEQQYPLRKIYPVASLSGKRGKNIAQQQVVYLKNTNPIIRYWAILGLRSQPEALLKAYRSNLLQAMGDEYPPVKITASAIAFDLFSDKNAETILKEAASGSNEHLALMAVNYMLYFKNKLPFKDMITGIANNKKINQNVAWAALDYLGSIGKRSQK
ncbi:MAG: sulfatase-like hydrolase/transferase [Niabella sp.]